MIGVVGDCRGSLEVGSKNSSLARSADCLQRSLGVLCGILGGILGHGRRGQVGMLQSSVAAELHLRPPQTYTTTKPRTFLALECTRYYNFDRIT